MYMHESRIITIQSTNLIRVYVILHSANVIMYEKCYNVMMTNLFFLNKFD